MVNRPADIPERYWVPPVTPTVAPVTATATLSVSEYERPQITSIAATPGVLSCPADPEVRQAASLTAIAAHSACGGRLSYQWTVSEGSVTNYSGPNATFDACSLSFENTNQGQSKTVTATVTVTDEAGKSATRSTILPLAVRPNFSGFRILSLPETVLA